MDRLRFQPRSPQRCSSAGRDQTAGGIDQVQHHLGRGVGEDAHHQGVVQRAPVLVDGDVGGFFGAGVAVETLHAQAGLSLTQIDQEVVGLVMAGAARRGGVDQRHAGGAAWVVVGHLQPVDLDGFLFGAEATSPATRAPSARQAPKPWRWAVRWTNCSTAAALPQVELQTAGIGGGDLPHLEQVESQADGVAEC